MELSLIRLYVRLFLCLIPFLGTLQLSHANPENRSLEQIGADFSEVLKYADANMWDVAENKAESFNASVAFDIIQWLKLRAQKNDFSEYESFLLINADWPGMTLLRSQGERAIDASVKPSRILKYFSNQEPLTANGSLKYAEALSLNQQKKKAKEIIKKSWLEHSYSINEFEQVNRLFGSFLAEYNTQRIDNLLWLDRVKQAQKMLSLVSSDIRRLSEARIALKRQSPGVDLLIKKVPKHLKSHPGLLFDRFSYRQKKDLVKGAEQILLMISSDAYSLGRPNFWVKGRLSRSRGALLRGDPGMAYEIAKNHFINFTDDDTDKEAAELEWLAGFIAFEFLHKYDLALEHFKRFFQLVVHPINQAKASYWIGRSYEKLSKPHDMMAAYEIGSQFQTTFYGQLAAERGNFSADSTLVDGFDRYGWETAEFMKRSTVKAAILLYYSGRLVLADRFFNHASEELERVDRLKLSQLAFDLGLKASGVSIAKTAGKDGMFCPDFLFPKIERNLKIDKKLQSLVTAIIRQESGFFSSTKSSAGAIGLMQVMPRTASSMANKLGIPFDENKLMRDKNYNIKIGTYFLNTLLEKFDRSKVLSIAAYNAGPYRVKEWISQFGDPRSKGIDPLVWIELIPFLETRNYVKRVLEADWVYQGKVNEEPAQLNLGRQTFGHSF